MESSEDLSNSSTHEWISARLLFEAFQRKKTVMEVKNKFRLH
jgi:hypothetical protein